MFQSGMPCTAFMFPPTGSTTHQSPSGIGPEPCSSDVHCEPGSASVSAGRSTAVTASSFARSAANSSAALTGVVAGRLTWAAAA